MKNFYVIKLNGLTGYGDGLELQKKVFDIVSMAEADGVLILLQHKPTFTIGRNGGQENLLVSKEMLNEYGIELHEANRGGNITYHGPGQLVGYPIFNLKMLEKNVIWYVRKLEEALIRTLSSYELNGDRKSEYPGVWIGDGKIAAIGVHAKKWITTHGFAFNIAVNKEHFGLINPCGIKEFGVASLDDYLDGLEFNDVVDRVETAFEEVFEIRFKSLEVDCMNDFTPPLNETRQN